MAENTTGEMQATLGLTGLTMNAMALIAPGAFLMAHVRSPRSRRCHIASDVDWYHHRTAVMSSNCYMLCGNGEALPWHWQFVLFR